MAIRVASSETTRDPGQEYVKMSRSRGGGEMDEFQELFEQLMGGEDGEDIEGMEDFDWEGLWDSFMEGEEGYSQEEQEQVQGSHLPTMFGSRIRPAGFNSPLQMNYY